jgi:flagellar biosynthetic protein FliQ
MDLEIVSTLLRNAIIETLVLVGPVLLISFVVGFLISIFQATTSLQDQTISMVPKLLAIFLVLILLGPWMFKMMAEYTEALFSDLASIAQN